jgi:hypothetical protein
MNPYKYTISLIIIGDFEAARLKQGLGLDDAVTKNKGDRRGTKVGGEVVYQERSSIRKLFFREADGDVVNSVNEICTLLEAKGTDYLKVSQEHHVELFIGLFGDKNFGFEFDRTTLKRVEQLGLMLSFDVYPDDGLATTDEEGKGSEYG